jgi:hypothetical protein
MPRHEQKPEMAKATGITPEIAAELDKAVEEMEAQRDVHLDPTSETPQYQADIGRNTYARHEGISSNEQILFSTLVEREKNQDPDIEHAEAYDRAVDRFNAMQDEDE